MSMWDYTKVVKGSHCTTDWKKYVMDKDDAPPNVGFLSTVGLRVVLVVRNRHVKH